MLTDRILQVSMEHYFSMLRNEDQHWFCLQDESESACAAIDAAWVKGEDFNHISEVMTSLQFGVRNFFCTHFQ